MINFRPVLTACLLLLLGLLLAAGRTKQPRQITRLAFGSCNNQSMSQPLWPAILDYQPDVWIWLGDNIYGDTYDMGELKRKYDQQKNQFGYAQLRKKTNIIGIWDDHDYGKDNAGKNYGPKAESKNLLMDFLDVPAGSPVRQRQGAYSVHTYGLAPAKVKVILLDCRYFRDDLVVPIKLMLPNPAGDILGEEQWQWLEKELSGSDASVHIIGNGIQIISTGYSEEKWANFPRSRNRLFKLIEKTKPAHTILLSGDRHLGEISRIRLKDYPYPIYEITASGMTHTRKLPKTKAKHLVACPVNRLHYGSIEIDWNASPFTIHTSIKGMGNDTLLYQKITYLQ